MQSVDPLVVVQSATFERMFYVYDPNADATTPIVAITIESDGYTVQVRGDCMVSRDGIVLKEPPPN